MLVIKFKGIAKAGKGIQKWADDQKKNLDKAQTIALSKVGYKYSITAQTELKSGKLGLASKVLYRNALGDPNYSRGPTDPDNPLSGLHRGITYFVKYNTKTLTIGFRGVTGGTRWQARIARKSVDGYRIRITKPKRDMLHSCGIHLRRETKSIKVPPRDIMGAFYQRHYNEMLKEFKVLFLRKMAGEQIYMGKDVNI